MVMVAGALMGGPGRPPWLASRPRPGQGPPGWGSGAVGEGRMGRARRGKQLRLEPDRFGL